MDESVVVRIGDKPGQLTRFEIERRCEKLVYEIRLAEEIKRESKKR
jgi:hypothetical protein